MFRINARCLSQAVFTFSIQVNPHLQGRTARRQLLLPSSWEWKDVEAPCLLYPGALKPLREVVAGTHETRPPDLRSFFPQEGSSQALLQYPCQLAFPLPFLLPPRWSPQYLSKCMHSLLSSLRPFQLLASWQVLGMVVLLLEVHSSFRSIIGANMLKTFWNKTNPCYFCSVFHYAFLGGHQTGKSLFEVEADRVLTNFLLLLNINYQILSTDRWSGLSLALVFVTQKTLCRFFWVGPLWS